MQLFNSLTRKKEELTLPKTGKVGMYTCGPTVYSTATIGNFRTYILSDLLARSLRYLGSEVKHVMNLTDVGHLTGDNEGDADTGEDRLVKAAKTTGKNAWDIAREYASEFMMHMESINIQKPDVVCKATDHIKEQIELILKLEARGYTYKISDGIYFDTISYEKMGNVYGQLSTLGEIKEGARVEVNTEKKNARDFALWKFSPLGERRQMEWESPWGMGYPGWHIECSAMSMKYLGERFLLHVGGEDLRSTHHPNEIAQSEGATGKKPFVKMWVHGAFLLVDGGRMGKSLGNAYTVETIKTRGFDPLALRYFYMTGHYRKQINFTWEALTASASALDKLRRVYFEAGHSRDSLSPEKMGKIENYLQAFRDALADDLDMPRALAVVWEVVKSNIPGRDKQDLLASMDQVLGLDLAFWSPAVTTVTEEVTELLKKREEARAVKDFKLADEVRAKLEEAGYKIEDTNGVSRIVGKKS